MRRPLLLAPLLFSLLLPLPPLGKATAMRCRSESCFYPLEIQCEGGRTFYSDAPTNLTH